MGPPDSPVARMRIRCIRATGKTGYRSFARPVWPTAVWGYAAGSVGTAAVLGLERFPRGGGGAGRGEVPVVARTDTGVVLEPVVPEVHRGADGGRQPRYVVAVRAHRVVAGGLG